MNAMSLAPIQYNYSGVLVDPWGLSLGALNRLSNRLDTVRTQILADDLDLYRSARPVPPDKAPLDAGFIDLPERLLADYRQSRQESELGQILAVGNELADQVDHVVVLGIGGSYMGARALMEACCHPYHNLLSRGQRGSRPRLYFEGNNLDNDALQGLLDILPNSQNTVDPEQRWAIVVISKSGTTLETAVAFRVLLRALSACCGEMPDRLAARVVPVTGQSGRLWDLSRALGCRHQFRVPDGVGGRFSVLSAVGLLPAAILGLDVIRLLEGAVAMNQHFREAPCGENAVLDYAAVCYLMNTCRRAPIRILSAWAKSLEAVGLWYDQLMAESLAKKETEATPVTVVNTRDLHSRGQQHQEGRRDKLITNLVVDQWRCDPIGVGTSRWNQDQLNTIADRTIPDLMAAAVSGTNQAYHDDGRPTADILLPCIDETSLGQLMQMLMLATVVEGYLMGVNPYGQPGVEKYKRNMQKVLAVSTPPPSW